jgi:hypothetical protein
MANDEMVKYFFDGNRLHQVCETDIVACSMYILGVVDSVNVYGIANEFKNCLPDNVTRKQVADIVIKFLSETPEKRHFMAPSLIVAKVSNAFPCD